MRVDDPTPEPWSISVPPSDETLTGEYGFRGSVGVPLLLWDAPLRQARNVGEARARFEGNVEQFEARQIEWRDASNRTSLAEAEFWPTIDVLGARTSQKSLAIAERTLSRENEDFIAQWAQTAGLKALALSNRFRSAGLNDLDNLWVIGATLSRGADEFGRVLDDPSSFDAKWIGDQSPQVVWIASGALRRIAHREIHMTTSFAGVEDYALVESAESLFREFGNDPIAGPELNHASGFSNFFNTVVFTIKRRSAMSLAEYLAHYSTSPA